MGFSGVFNVCTKKLRNFIACVQWQSNPHYNRPIRGAKRCNIKKGNFLGEQIAFPAKKFQKGVFRVFRQCATKTLGNFASMLQLRSNLQDTRPFNLDDGKLKTDAQNIILFFFSIFQFFKVSPRWFWLRTISTRCPLSYSHSAASIAVKVTVQPPIRSERCANKEWQAWLQRSTLWTKKNVEKTGFPENSKETFRSFNVSLQLSSNWQDTCPL